MLKSLFNIVKFLFILSLVLFSLSCFKKDDLPDKKDVVKMLYQEPRQTPTQRQPFDVSAGEYKYHIVPLYDYELYGLVVSYNNNMSWLDYYHRQWGDSINIKDVCVIWGDNIETEVYKHLKFWSESWTCYWRSKPGITKETWSKFKNEQLSNNHLLSADADINRAISKIDKGDQVYIKGFLANYTQPDWGEFKRTSSIKRSDRGQGACEIVYVEEFRILKKANPLFSSIYKVSKYSAVVFLVLLIVLALVAPLS